MIGRLRLWSAYVLLAYVTTHLLNHSLGLISLRVLEAGRSLVRLRLGELSRARSRSTARWRCISRWRSTPSCGGAPCICRPGNGRSSCSACRSCRSPRCTSPARGWPRTCTTCTSAIPGCWPRWSAGTWIGDRAPVRPDLRGLDPRLHRPPLRLAPAALVPHLAAGALCRGAAAAGGRARRCRRSRCATSPSWRSSRASCADLFDQLNAPNGHDIAQPLHDRRQPARRPRCCCWPAPSPRGRCAICGSGAPAWCIWSTATISASTSRRASASWR